MGVTLEKLLRFNFLFVVLREKLAAGKVTVALVVVVVIVIVVAVVVDSLPLFLFPLLLLLKPFFFLLSLLSFVLFSLLCFC